MYQEPELNVEEKSNASVNKRLYKLLIIILRYTPVVLSINDGYNIQEGGYTSLTKESLDKMSKSLKQGYIDHPERKKRISEKLTGRKNSEETKRKKSLNNVRTKLISIDGELGSIRFWAIRIGMSHTALNYRLKTYGEDNLISFIKQKLN